MKFFLHIILFTLISITSCYAKNNNSTPINVDIALTHSNHQHESTTKNIVILRINKWTPIGGIETNSYIVNPNQTSKNFISHQSLAIIKLLKATKTGATLQLLMINLENGGYEIKESQFDINYNIQKNISIHNTTGSINLTILAKQ